MKHNIDSYDQPEIPLTYRADIDGLRAIAVISVVLFHAGLGVNGGFVGVDVFFVISGYLLSKIVIQELHENTFSFITFYERRFRRLAPAFIVMLACCLIVFSLIMLPKAYSNLSHSGIASIFFYANFYFYNDIDYFSQSADLMPLLHMWSLSIEEQFYALLPLAIMLTLTIVPRRWLPALIAMALALSLVLCIYYTNAYRPLAFYMPYTRAWELLAGTLLASLHRLSGSPRSMNWVGSIALITILIVVFTFDERDAFPGWIAVIPVTATAALIYCGAVAPTSLPSQILGNPVLVFIGKISYSLYLWHWPVIVFVKYSDLTPENLVTRLGCVLVSCLIAVLSWAYIEQPVRRKKVFSSPQKIYACVAASGVALGIAALAIIRLDGLPSRVPPDLRVLLESDRYETSGEECFFRRNAAQANPCLLGSLGDNPSYILIGDSHAFALSPALIAATKEKKIAGLYYTAPGFFPGLGMTLAGSNRRDPRSDRMMQIISAHPDVRTVIISAAWADYASGTNWKGSHLLYQDNVSAASTTADNSEIFHRAITRMVTALPKHNIILLDDVPAGIDLDLDYFVRRSMLRPLKRVDAFLPFEKVTDRRTVYVPLLKKIAAQNENVRFVPVFADFCSEQTGCPLFMDDLETPIYKDGDHLSRLGALTWANRFRDRVLPQIIDEPFSQAGN